MSLIPLEPLLGDSNTTIVANRVTRYEVSWAKPFAIRDYKRVVESHNPVGYWKLEKDTIDSPPVTLNWGNSGGNSGVGWYKGTYEGTVVAAQWTTGVAYACDEAFDFSNNYIDCNAVPISSAGSGNLYSLTLEAWINFGSDPGYIVSTATDGSGNTDFEMWIDGSGNLNFGAHRATVLTSKKSTAVLLPNENYHVVVTWDTTGVYVIYINGVQDSTGTIAIGPRVYGQHVLIGAYYNGTTYSDYFSGLLDEVAVYNHILPSGYILEHYDTGANIVNPEVGEDLETDAVYTTSTNEDFISVMEASAPDHWYRLGDSTGTTLVDSGSNPQNGTHDTGATRFTPGAITGSEDDGARFLDRSFGVASVPAQIGTQKTYNDITIEFWFKRDSTSSNYDAVIGCGNLATNGYGWYIFTHLDGMYFTKGINGSYSFNPNVWSSSNRSSYTFGTNSYWPNQATNDDWHHTVVTVDTLGNYKMYHNGEVVIAGRYFDFTGVQMPESTDSISLGGNPSGAINNANPGMYMDELAIYGRVLSQDEIAQHYLTGHYGTSVGNNVVLSSPDDNTSPYSQVCSDLPSLINGQDISDQVDPESLQVNYDLSSMIHTASFSVFESWGTSNIQALLRANDYVVIEQRIMNSDGSNDSGWYTLGHFLIDGPAGLERTADGKKVYKISLRSIMKLATLDVAHWDIAPDYLPVSRTLLVNTNTSLESITFQCPRPEDSTKYYTNWAEKPSPQFWVTKLRNLDPINTNDPTAGNSNPDQVLRIKGASDSVQVLGGAGELVIDLNYYSDKISQNGLGDPNPSTGVSGTFYRYCTTEDLTYTTVTGIAYDTDWYITVNSDGKDYTGKTIIPQTGNATNKLFTVAVSSPDTPPQMAFSSNVSTATGIVGETPHIGWANPGFVQTKDGSFATLNGTLTLGEGVIYSDYLVCTSLEDSNDPIPSYATIEGVEVHVYRNYNGVIPDSSFSNTGVKVTDQHCYLVKGGTVQTGTDKAITANVWPTSSVVQDIVYGGPNDLWGLTLAPSDIGSGFGVAFSIKCDCTGSSSLAIGNGYPPQVDAIQMRVYYNLSGRLYVRDINLLPINPYSEGLAVGDTIQIGDCNRIEDALRKVFLKIGLQNVDSTKPFYFQINPCSVATTLPPFRHLVTDNIRWNEVLNDMLAYAPPNYNVYQNNQGWIVVDNIVQKNSPDVSFLVNFDSMLDATDYNVYTKIVAIGQGTNSVNIALHQNYGGSAAVRTYKLSDMVKWNGTNDTTEPEWRNHTYSTTTLSQSDANAVIEQVLDGSERTPAPGSLSSGIANLCYGLIWQKIDSVPPLQIQPNIFEDTDLFVIDLGRNGPLNKQYSVDAIYVSFISLFYSGTVVPQTIFVYYMTEEDFIGEFGVAPPATPDQTDADASVSKYMPTSTARSWKPLVDETKLSNGQVQIANKDFVALNPGPVNLRYLKVRVGQCDFRWEIPNGENIRVANIGLTDFQVYTNSQIIATAELGVTPPLNTGDFKKLAQRLNRRTYVLDQNLYLNTFQSTKSYAISELIERYSDFLPLALHTYYPTLQLGVTGGFTDPETGNSTNYLVGGYSVDGLGRTKARIINYSVGV